MVTVVKFCLVKFCTTLHIARINVQCDIRKKTEICADQQW